MAVDKEFIRKTKQLLNVMGKYNLDPKSPDVGPKTITALNMELAARGVIGLEPVPPVVPRPIGDFFGAPWVFSNIDLLGRYETDPVLVARYEPEWKLEGLSGFRGLAGNARAWCSLKVNADFRKAGIKGTNSAGAASWSKWGHKSQFFFGCVLDIIHAGGGRHVCFFLYWIDEANGICATMDGNRGNQFCIARTNISGKGKADRLGTGPRWSNDLPDGQLVSMADVLKKYPYLKVGSVAAGTK